VILIESLRLHDAELADGPVEGAVERRLVAHERRQRQTVLNTALEGAADRGLAPMPVPISGGHGGRRHERGRPRRRALLAEVPAQLRIGDVDVGIQRDGTHRRRSARFKGTVI
jgi:hypothetical protein